MRIESLCKFLGDGFALLDIFRFEVLLHEPNVVLEAATMFCCTMAFDVNAVRSPDILMP